MLSNQLNSVVLTVSIKQIESVKFISQNWLWNITHKTYRYATGFAYPSSQCLSKLLLADQLKLKKYKFNCILYICMCKPLQTHIPSLSHGDPVWIGFDVSVFIFKMSFCLYMNKDKRKFFFFVNILLWEGVVDSC